MKILARVYDRDDFLYRTSVEVLASELANTIRAVKMVLGISEFKVCLASNDLFIIFYDDVRSFKLGAKIAPRISDHQEELDKAISYFLPRP